MDPSVLWLRARQCCNLGGHAPESGDISGILKKLKDELFGDFADSQKANEEHRTTDHAIFSGFWPVWDGRQGEELWFACEETGVSTCPQLPFHFLQCGPRSRVYKFMLTGKLGYVVDRQPTVISESAPWKGECLDMCTTDNPPWFCEFHSKPKETEREIKRKKYKSVTIGIFHGPNFFELKKSVRFLFSAKFLTYKKCYIINLNLNSFAFLDQMVGGEWLWAAFGSVGEETRRMIEDVGKILRDGDVCTDTCQETRGSQRGR